MTAERVHERRILRRPIGFLGSDATARDQERENANKARAPGVSRIESLRGGFSAKRRFGITAASDLSVAVPMRNVSV